MGGLYWKPHARSDGPDQKSDASPWLFPHSGNLKWGPRIFWGLWWDVMFTVGTEKLRLVHATALVAGGTLGERGGHSALLTFHLPTFLMVQGISFTSYTSTGVPGCH